MTRCKYLFNSTRRVKQITEVLGCVNQNFTCYTANTALYRLHRFHESTCEGWDACLGSASWSCLKSSSLLITCSMLSSLNVFVALLGMHLMASIVAMNDHWAQATVNAVLCNGELCESEDRTRNTEPFETFWVFLFSGPETSLLRAALTKLIPLRSFF